MADGERQKLVPEAEDELDQLKQQVAQDLGLDDDIQKRGWENMTTREVGKIGGQMVTRMIKRAEAEMAQEGSAAPAGRAEPRDLAAQEGTGPQANQAPEPEQAPEASPGARPRRPQRQRL